MMPATLFCKKPSLPDLDIFLSCPETGSPVYYPFIVFGGASSAGFEISL
jgi:hypothetical protein